MALCVEINGDIVCKPVASRNVEEKFLWSYVGGALVNKFSGKVLEASPDVAKPPLLRSASTPLRKSQIWKFEPNQTLHSKNDRMLFVSPTHVSPDSRGFLVFGCQYDTAARAANSYDSWRLASVHESNVSHRDFTSAVMPPQKMPSLMPVSSPEAPAPSSFIRNVPGDSEITVDDLLFRPDFCMENNEEYRSLRESAKDPEAAKAAYELIRKEWSGGNGIRNGRWGSPAFDVKFYLEANKSLQEKVGPNNFMGAVEYFLQHFDEPVQTSSKFYWQTYAKHPDLRHLTPKQLFWHFNHIGYDEKQRAV